MKKLIEKPEVKVMKLEAMDVIATSGDTEVTRGVGLEGVTYRGTDWIQISNQ